MSQGFPAHLAGFRAGTMLAGYRLEAPVGAGGMAVVFRARDERLDRLVALKILAPASAADTAFRRRFIAESRAAAAADDPHIIPIYEAGEAGGVLFIAMRFVQGGDLGLVLEREGPLSPDRAASFISPVASALDAAHRAGLVHRDVKPANILVDARQDRPDHVYLSDFGVSKAAASVSLTGTGFLGTPDYAPPEQIEGRLVDGRTDQYALACVSYQLLTGAVPFGRDQAMAVLAAQLMTAPPSVVSRRPDLPGADAVDQVLARAMAKAPEERYESCGDFADALREALGLLPYRPRSSAAAPTHPQYPATSPSEVPWWEKGPGQSGDVAEGVPSNPFTYGNPISDPRRFFGRIREVEQIFGRLRNEEFESSSVVGDRRIGKTSLLNYLANPGIRTAAGLGPERYTFVYVDLQMVDEAMGPEQLWRRLLALMRRQCVDHEIVQMLAALQRRDRLDTFDLDELFQEIDDRGLHVVFLLDEFERVTENANFGPDFYYGLRSLIIHHKVALITSSRLELIKLCHSEAIKSSPFFNIFANINLRQFSQADFQLMVSQSLDGTPVRFSETEMGHVLDLAGLHPYFLQAACCMLYESHRMSLEQADRIAFLAEKFRAQAIPQIVDYWGNSGDYEKIVLTAAALLERTARPTRGFSVAELQGVFSRGEPWAEHLDKRGLLMSTDSRYRLFSSVLGLWILHEIAAELSEENTYQEWLAQNTGSVEQILGKQGGPLRDILPKIGARYRQLIITWASDPQSVAAMAGLLNSVLAHVS